MRRLLLDAMAAAEEPPPLCRRIRAARERLEISQEEAARRLHLSLKGYTAYERFREPKPSRARDIALAFELPEDYFEKPSEPTDESELAALRGELGEVLRLVRLVLDLLEKQAEQPSAQAGSATAQRPV